MYNRAFAYNGFRIVEFDPRNFKLVYWDRTKKSAPYTNCFNAGFFAYFAESVNGRKQKFTLPIGNIVADDVGMCDLSRKYINEWTGGVKGGKVRMASTQNGSKGAVLTTLIVSPANVPKIVDTNALPSDCKYAISGVPCIRNGKDVDWHKYVAPQGWAGTMGKTYRNWLAIKDGAMYLISGRTYTGNYIYGMEFWNKAKNLRLDDCIGLDGGGSYFSKINGKMSATLENRRINSIGVII